MQYVLFDSKTGAIWVSPELSPGTNWQRVPSPEQENSDALRDPSLSELDKAERNAILRALKETGGNKLEASKRLGIGRQTLYNRLADLGITDEDQGG